MSETDAAGMAAGLNSQADNGGSAEAANAGKDGTQAKTETPAKIDATAISVTPAKGEMTVKTETPAKDETQVKTETTDLTKMPAKGETPNKAETSLKPETVIKTESPDNAGAPIKAESTIKIETPVKTEATAETEKLVKTETIAKTETPTKDRTPADCAGEEISTSARANERQEIRSKQTIDLAREKAEHSEAMAIERAQSSSSMEKVITEKSESARERRECNDVAISAKDIAAPSISEEGKRSTLPATTAQDSQKDEKSDAALGPASAGSPLSAQKGKDAASLSRASASTSRVQAHTELKSSRSEQSEKITDLRADRTNAAAASKASAANLRARDLSERMKAKEKVRETALSAANARKSKLQESRSRPTVE